MNGKKASSGRRGLAAGAGIFFLSVVLLCASFFSGKVFAEKEELKVVNTFPVNGGQDVFLMSGIEITFNSDAVSAESLESAFQISPDVEFHVTEGEDDHTLVVYPYSEYEPETQYRVTIRAGLASDDGMELPEDVEFTFSTASEDLVSYYQGTILAPAGQGIVMNALTTEIPAAFLLIDEDLVSSFGNRAPEADVTLYRFESDEDFLAALVQSAQDKEKYYQGKDLDPSRGKSLREEAAFTVKADAVTDDNYWWWRYQEYVLSFPEKLPEGHYLAKLEFPVKTKHQEFLITKYLLVQSTELSSFIMSSGQNSVAWIHNGVNGETVPGAEISLYGSSVYADAVTSDDGTGRLSFGASDGNAVTKGKVDQELADRIPYSYRILDITAGEHRFIEAVTDYVLYDGYIGFGSYSGSTQYYTYLYTDRQIYSTTDDVQFFGVILPRTKETSIPDSLKISISEAWWGMDEIASVEVQPDEKGFFTGALSIEDQQAASYVCLNAADKMGNILMTSESFSIEDYVKPTYTWESEADKPVYVLGKNGDEEAVISIDVHYFDDTPAAGFGLQNEWYSDGVEPSGDMLNADGNGHIEDHVRLIAEQYSNTWRPQESVINYQSADIEDEKLYMEQSLMVIPRDTMLLTETDSENHTLKVYTYAVDVSGIKERKDLYDTDLLKGEGLSASVTGKMYKCWYEKISDGIKYDPIYKSSYEAYHYIYHEDLIDTYTIETTDGEGSLTYELEHDEENPACYYMKLEVPDQAGRMVETTAGLYYRSLSRYMAHNNNETVYRMKPQGQPEEEPEEPYNWGWYYEPDGKFSENAPQKYILVRDEEVFEMPEGGDLLTASLLRDFSNIETGPETERSVSFSENLLPNYYVIGAYFDGANTWPLTVTRMNFDYDTRKLDIAVEGDQEVYRPGDSVTVTADVSRALNGSKVPEGTKVVLGVVDEAIFALREQSISILEQLYRRFNINYSNYSSRNTAVPSESGMKGSDAMEEAEEADAAPAENAEGGRIANAEEYIRSEFKDSAYFAMAETDAEGRAEFTFALPDNMTSWRLSVIAVTEDVWAGSTVKDIICTSPYYTVPVLNDIMLEGESFAVGLRSAGTIEDPGVCTYEVSVRREGEEEILLEGTATGTNLRDYTYIVLDPLEEGAYTVRIKGSCGEYSDISEYPITVVHSGLEAYVSKSGPVSDMAEIHPMRYPVQLMLYDKDAYVYNAVLSGLLCSREIRADERLGAHFALTILSEGEDSYFQKMLDDHDISDLRYIFPQFTYAKNDAEISALAYLALPELLDSKVIRGIMPSDISESLDSPYTGSPYAAYLLQALAGDEYTDDPAELLQDENLAFRDRIYLMAALFVSGDEAKAREAFETYAVPYLKSSEAVSGEVVYFIDADKNTTVQDDTAAALIMASLLHREEARGMALYLLEKPSDKNIYPLEEVLYLKNCEEKDGETCTVSYVLDGETHTEELRRNRRIHLNLQKNALESLELHAVSGEPYATVFYIAGLDDITDESNMKLSASVHLDQKIYAPGDEAKITITPDIGSLDPTIGCSTMILDVYIPSGMRFERYTPDTSDWQHWYLISREGQRLRFMLYDGSEERKGSFAPVTFTASCVTPGEYIVEKVYISSNHYDTWGLSERGSVTITED